MVNEKLLEVLSHPADGIISIVTQGTNEPHVVNSWNSYVIVKDDGFLIPVGGMIQTEKNLINNNKVKVTIGSREVQGKMYKGTGFLIRGTAQFIKEGASYDEIRTKFPWARATLHIHIEAADQTL